MKWLGIALKVLEFIQWVLPGNAGKGKLADDLEVAKETIKVLTEKLPAKEKGNAVIKAVGNLSAVKGCTDRVAKKWDKAKNRFWKKMFDK